MRLKKTRQGVEGVLRGSQNKCGWFNEPEPNQRISRFPGIAAGGGGGSQNFRYFKMSRSEVCCSCGVRGAERPDGTQKTVFTASISLPIASVTCFLYGRGNF
jgi:hypothetical protein